MKKNFKILDCTLRDGGYYTDWDFEDNTVDEYVRSMNSLPVDYLEIGYRNNPSKEYLGKLGYSPTSVLAHIRKLSHKKLCIMLNEKNTLPSDLKVLLAPITGLIDMVRIAIDPMNFERAVALAKAVKSYGFEVGFNVMYMSRWLEQPDFMEKLHLLDDFVDLFCMVDSFGGITPSEVRNIICIVKKNTSCPIGFHGHDNLQLGLINTITAIDCGVDFVDSTILGMGRGAGNLKTELLLTYLNKEGLTIDFNVLGDVVSAFTPLLEKYRWGTQLPYMISGANSIPQKEVMELVTNRVYPFNSIVRNLQNRKNHIKDNAQYPVFKPRKFKRAILIGGGNSIKTHFEAIHLFADQEPNTAFVFATARHAALFQEMSFSQFYCLLGPEARRLSKNVGVYAFKGTCILPPYPRRMGTDVPDFAQGSTFELESIRFTTEYPDSCTTLALQTALDICDGDIYVVGYDGYPGNVLSEKEVSLSQENKILFEEYYKVKGKKLVSLTPSLYQSLNVDSIYRYI